MASLLAGAHAHPLARLWRSYEHALETRPLLTQSITSGALWGVGDVLAQRFTRGTGNGSGSGNGGEGLDVRRTALTALFGGAVIGPSGTYWYRYLDRLAGLFGPEGSLRFLLAKLAADSTVWNVWYMSAFFAWGELVIERGTLRDWTQQMKEEFVPTYLAEIAAWPPVMAAIFTRLPTSHHLLAVNLVTVLDVAFLAVIRSGALRLGDLTAAAPWARAGGAHAQGGDTSSQGEELLAPEVDSGQEVEGGAAQPSTWPHAPWSQHKAGGSTTSAQAHPYLGYRALASVHSASSGAPPGAAAEGGAASAHMSLIEQWVRPEHRPGRPGGKP